MSFVETIDRVADWLEEEVCPLIRLKVGEMDPTEAAAQGGEWEYRLVHPSVWRMYAPTSTDRPEDVPGTVPAIVLEPREVADDLNAQSRSVRLRLSLVAWDPGTHGQDSMRPVEGAPPRELGEYGTYEAGPPGQCRLNHEGWRDAWNFTDVCLRAIEDSESMGGLAIDRGAGVRAGTLDYQDAPVDIWPLWVSWVEVTVTEPLFRYRKHIESLL